MSNASEKYEQASRGDRCPFCRDDSQIESNEDQTTYACLACGNQWDAEECRERAEEILQREHDLVMDREHH